MVDYTSVQPGITPSVARRHVQRTAIFGVGRRPSIHGVQWYSECVQRWRTATGSSICVKMWRGRSPSYYLRRRRRDWISCITTAWIMHRIKRQTPKAIVVSFMHISWSERSRYTVGSFRCAILLALVVALRVEGLRFVYFQTLNLVPCDCKCWELVLGCNDQRDGVEAFTLGAIAVWECEVYLVKFHCVSISFVNDCWLVKSIIGRDVCNIYLVSICNTLSLRFNLTSKYMYSIIQTIGCVWIFFFFTHLHTLA